MKIEIIKSGQLETNSTIISEHGKCAIFDPDGDIAMWREILNSRGLQPIGIYLTHGHFDHVGAVADLCSEYNIKWYMNENDLPLIKQNNMFGFFFGASRVKTPPKELFVPLSKNMEILPGLNAEVINTPGHTAGGVCFYFTDLNLLISGDTLFADTVGRTDLPFASYKDLMQSIERLRDMNFPPNTHVIPGHGRDSNIANITIENQYFQ
ncbi:MBL fold hydrolase [Bacteroidia bacterium]|nr:MBL fold hydrolase [Bacteroidia bacterium]